MGRVYSYREVVNNQVPELADFKVASALFDERVEAGLEAGEILSAVRYGSVAAGRPTERSDFDCVVVPYDENSLFTRQLAAELAANDLGKVQFQPISHPYRLLVSSRHDIDRFFGSHLTGPFSIQLGKNLAEYISYDDAPASAIFKNYVHHKKRSLIHAKDSVEEPVRLKGLQRMLELPLAVGRKLLLGIDEIQGGQRTPDNTADKQAVAHHSLELFRQLGLMPMATTLLAADKEYSTDLRDTLKGHVSDIEYARLLEHLVSLLPSTLRWLDKVEKIVADEELLIKQAS